MLKTNIANNFGLFLMVIVPLSIYAFLLIDKLIKRLYEDFHDEWCKVGKPSGLLYFPPESKNLQSLLSFQINIHYWVFKTPKWIKNDSLSFSYLKKIRLSLAIANILIIVFFVMIVVSLRQ